MSAGTQTRDAPSRVTRLRDPDVRYRLRSREIRVRRGAVYLANVGDRLPPAKPAQRGRSRIQEADRAGAGRPGWLRQPRTHLPAGWTLRRCGEAAREGEGAGSGERRDRARAGESLFIDRAPRRRAHDT